MNEDGKKRGSESWWQREKLLDIAVHICCTVHSSCTAGKKEAENRWRCEVGQQRRGRSDEQLAYPIKDAF